MARLSERDQRRVADVARELRVWGSDRHPVEAVAGSLRELLDVPRAAVFAVKLERDLQLDFAHVRGALCGDQHAPPLIDEHVRTRQRSFGAFDVVSPEPRQRNHVFALPALPTLLRELEHDRGGLGRKMGIQADEVFQRIYDYGGVLRSTGFDVRQLRVLVCDGPALIAWVGAAQDDPFTTRQHAVLRSLVPALRERLTLDRQLRDAPLAKAALDATLDAIPGAAFVVTGQGIVRFANAAGLELQRRIGKRALLDGFRARDGSPPAFRKLAIVAPGIPRWYLAIACPDPIDPERIAAARVRWGLTRRQTEVLARVLRGATNKAIAVELGLVESTVELHVSALLDRVEVSSRAELIAAFWCGGPP